MCQPAPLFDGILLGAPPADQRLPVHRLQVHLEAGNACLGANPACAATSGSFWIEAEGRSAS